MLTIIEQTAIKRGSKGERTKNLILEAAIAVLAEQGIKGTTHRAIAAHANIQLSLTTYYFKDIQALVQQAFELNSCYAMKFIKGLWQPILALVEKYTKVALRRVSLRLELQETLSHSLLQLIALNTTKNRNQLIVEQQLFTEIQHSPSLRLIAKQHHDAQLKPCLQLCEYFSKDKAKVNAQILLTVVEQIQYRQLLAETSVINNDNIRNMIQQTLAIVLEVKP